MTRLQHGNASLALKPLEWDASLDLATVTDACQQTGLIGAAINAHADRFYTGERFLDHITFLGCSPHIALQPEAGKTDFTHIVLHQHTQARLFYGQHTRPPHCPHCGKPHADWRNQIEAESMDCPHCQQSAPQPRYNWHKTAGVARTLIEITEIYPKEALPQPSLLAQLQQHTGVEWDYFYY